MPFELVGRISAHPDEERNPVWDDISSTQNAPNAATGAVNRPGNQAPAANPAALNAATPVAPTATGHHGGPPQAICVAVTASSTPVNSR